MLDLHTVVLMVHVVWNYLMEGNATVIETASTTIIIVSIATAALTILVKVMWVLHINLIALIKELHRLGADVGMLKGGAHSVQGRRKQFGSGMGTGEGSA